jgi:hypothetical protein
VLHPNRLRSSGQTPVQGRLRTRFGPLREKPRPKSAKLILELHAFFPCPVIILLVLQKQEQESRKEATHNLGICNERG